LFPALLEEQSGYARGQNDVRSDEQVPGEKLHGCWYGTSGPSSPQPLF